MNRALSIIVLCFALLAAAIASLTMGEGSPSVLQLLGLAPLPHDGVERIILVNLRLPRTLMAIGIGAMLSMSGAMMQTVFRNPLVEPYTMGLSGGAVLGVAIAIATGLTAVAGSAAITLCALAGAMLTMALVLLLRRAMLFSTNSMLLVGIMVSFATSSVTTLIMSLGSHETLTQIISWTMGSLCSADLTTSVFIAVAAAAATVVSPMAGNTLNALMLGEDGARHIGISTRIAVPLLFTIATTLAAVSVAMAGVIAFVGMIVPHISRPLCGTDHRFSLPATAIAGAAFMLVCDMVARLAAYPQEIPVGVISGIAGGIMFIYITARANGRA